MPNQPGSKPSPRSSRGSPAAASGRAGQSASNWLRLHVAQLSDVGQARDHQEDAVAVFAPSDPALLMRKGQLLIVADGMGGHNAGEVASQTAVAEIQRSYFAAATDDIPANLRQSLLLAHQVIRQLAQGDARRLGMGTTAAVAVVRDREVHIANIGDSRVYLARGGAIMQITQDHSWVEEQVRGGVLTLEQARSHPQRNVITRALGTGAAVEPDLFNGTLQEGDVLLLCSDGLSNLVSDAELLDVVSQVAPEQAVRRLVDLANERGGIDNISVIVARAESPEPLAAVAAPLRRPPMALLGIAALVLFAVGALAAILLTRRVPATTHPPTPGVLASPAGGAVVTTVAPTDTAQAAPGKETPVAAIVSPPSAETVQPTATLKPSDTPRPTATTAPTAQPARATTAPTAPAGAGSLPAPQLLKPDEGFTATERLAEEFQWQWPGSASQGYLFQIFMRKRGTENWERVLVPVPLGADGIGRQTVIVSSLPLVLVGGPGAYEWTVAVVNSAGARMSDYALPRRLVYPGSGAPEATAAPPTNTPRPPTPVPATEIPPPSTVPPPTGLPPP